MTSGSLKQKILLCVGLALGGAILLVSDYAYLSMRQQLLDAQEKGGAETQRVSVLMEQSEAMRQAANKLYDLDRETHRLRGLLEEANVVIEAARDVVAWDWSENDSDCVADIKALSMALDDLTPNA